MTLRAVFGGDSSRLRRWLPIRLDKVTYLVGGQHGFHHVLVDIDGDTITVINPEGEVLAEHTDPHPASPTSETDPEDHAPKSAQRHRSPDSPTVTDVLTQNRHQCPETSRLTEIPHLRTPLAQFDQQLATITLAGPGLVSA